MDADEKQFAVIYAKLKEHGEDGLPLLQGEIEKPLPDAAEEAKEALAKRQANAAVALLKMNHAGKRLAALEAQPRSAGAELPDSSFCPAWASSHGPRAAVGRGTGRIEPAGLDPVPWASSTRPSFQRPSDNALIAKLLDLYRTDPDPGLHGAAEWLLRQKGWDQGGELAKIDAQMHVDEKQLQARKGTEKRHWYVNTQGQTFVILNADKPFRMGSPEGEPERSDNEAPHQESIGRTFAIASKVVTTAQFRRFQDANPDVLKLDLATTQPHRRLPPG